VTTFKGEQLTRIFFNSTESVILPRKKADELFPLIHA